MENFRAGRRALVRNAIIFFCRIKKILGNTDHSRKMGQRPHPFSHKLLDSTNGAFLTSGRGCFTKPGSKNGSCVGVFRAPKKGTYKFELSGTQLLVNSKRSHFTGWIKKNGASLTGGFASAGDVTSIIGPDLKFHMNNES